MNYYAFDFLVENASAVQASELMDTIVAKVEELGLDMGGGYYPISDEDLAKKVDREAGLDALAEMTTDAIERLKIGESPKETFASSCCSCPDVDFCFSRPAECPADEGGTDVETG